MIQVNPKERLTCDGAHAHPWLKRDASELANHNLNNNLAALKKYQNNRKFRAAANAIIAVNRIGNMMGGSLLKSVDTTAAPEKTTPVV